MSDERGLEHWVVFDLHVFSLKVELIRAVYDTRDRVVAILVGIHKRRYKV